MRYKIVSDGGGGMDQSRIQQQHICLQSADPALQLQAVVSTEQPLFMGMYRVKLEWNAFFPFQMPKKSERDLVSEA